MPDFTIIRSNSDIATVIYHTHSAQTHFEEEWGVDSNDDHTSTIPDQCWEEVLIDAGYAGLSGALG